MHRTTPHSSRPWLRGLLASLSALPALSYASNSAWNVNSAGTFSTPSNWTAGVPGDATGNASTDIATFARSTITASRIVTFDAARNLGGITFDNAGSVNGVVYTVSAATAGQVTPTLTLSPNATVQNIGAGTNTTGANLLDASMLLTGTTTFSNTYGNSVLNIGVTNGTSANSILAAPDLGNVDLILEGTSTAGNLLSMRLNQGTGTTLRVLKQGTGFWQINGPTATASNASGGILIRQGGVSIGRNSTLAYGSGTMVVGDESTAAGDLRVAMGSSVTISSAVNVANSAATNVYFERGGGGGAGAMSGPISINRDVTFRQGTTATQALNLTSTSSLTGTGDVVVNTIVASAGTVNFQGSVNMVGDLINQSTTGTGLVTVSGLIGANVAAVTQASSTSNMALSNAGNLFADTNVNLGTLSITGSGRLGTGKVSVASGATLTLANNAAFSDLSPLVFGSTSVVNLNFTGIDKLYSLALGGAPATYIDPGIYNATELNSFFGVTVFSGSGELEVSAIPEPSAIALLAGFAALGFATLCRRRER